MAAPEPGATTGRAPLVALRYRDFRLLWAGQFLSQIGSQMFTVGIDWQVYSITRDPLSLGLLGLCRIVPLIIFGLGAGVIADAVDRRRLIIVCESVLLVLSAALAYWTARGLETVWPIYVVVALASVARTFETPARQAIVPALVPRQHLANALSLSILNGQVATVLGPSLAGLVIAYWNVGALYWLDSASYIALLISMLLMRTRVPPQEGSRISFGAALEGLRFLRHEPIILSTMALDFVATFFGSALTLLPVFAVEVLKVGPQQLGLLYAAPSAGAVLAGMAMSAIGSPGHQGKLLLAAVVAYGGFTAGFGFSTSFWLSLLMLAGTGAADTVSMVIRHTIRQLRTPDALRGRMVSVNMLFFMGGPQLGEFEAGLVARLAGGPFSVWSGGILCILAVAAIAWRVPELHRYEGSEQLAT